MAEPFNFIFLLQFIPKLYYHEVFSYYPFYNIYIQ